MALQGKSYTEIAQVTGINPSAVNPRSNIYQSLRTETGQEAMRAVASQYYDESKVRRIINKYLDRLDTDKKLSPLQAKAMLELAARSLGMLTDKTENMNMNENRQVKDIDRQAEDVLASLSIGKDGIEPSAG